MAEMAAETKWLIHLFYCSVCVCAKPTHFFSEHVYLSYMLSNLIPFWDLSGLQCFEGMKAYKTINDETDIRLFRPELNMKRLKNSMDRLAMPGSNFDPEELIRCIGELVRVGK